MSLRSKKKNSRDRKLLAIIISIGSIFILSILIAYIQRYPEVINFLGIPMNFHYFIFGLFVLFLGVITSFLVVRIVKAKNKTRRPKRLRK